MLASAARHPPLSPLALALYSRRPNDASTPLPARKHATPPDSSKQRQRTAARAEPVLLSTFRSQPTSSCTPLYGMPWLNARQEPTTRFTAQPDLLHFRKRTYHQPTPTSHCSLGNP